MDKGNIVGTLQLDLQKVFDTVDHLTQYCGQYRSPYRSLKCYFIIIRYCLLPFIIIVLVEFI